MAINGLKTALLYLTKGKGYNYQTLAFLGCMGPPETPPNITAVWYRRGLFKGPTIEPPLCREVRASLTAEMRFSGWMKFCGRFCY